MSDAAARVADATGNWVDTVAPPWSRPYLRLARLDRPIGSWLLLMPCWWAAALSAGVAHQASRLPLDIVLFFIGAFAMRGAGCTWNDITDRDLDAKVERTCSRPIPAGQVSVTQAFAFLVLQALAGLAVLLQFNRFAVATGIASLVIVAVYPFMKRITWWPQIVLGLAFSWGALMGFAVTFGRLDATAFVLYAGSICWVIAYDTIYAHQDTEDDALIGIKSTARLFAERTRSRPIPAGQVSVTQALIFLSAQALIGLGVLLQFNRFAIMTGIASLIIVAVYPFMKRITWWPQIVLGLAFSWGALMGFAVTFGRLDATAIVLYAGSISWVIGYDTIYAHQDTEDDALIGIKSTARLFAERTHVALIAFYALAVVLIGVALALAGARSAAWTGLAAFAAHLAWQVSRLQIHDSALCLRLFKSNRDAGLLLFAGLLIDAVMRAV